MILKYYKQYLKMPIQLPVIQHMNPANKIKILDYTYTSQPSINSALPLKLSYIKLVLFVIGSILTSGFLWLLSKWSATKRAIFMYTVCSVEEADYFLIEEEDIIGGSTIVSRNNIFDIRRKVQAIKFTYHERTYLYHQQKQVFLPIRYEDLGIQLDKLKKNKYKPYSKGSRMKLLQYYGINALRMKVQNRLQVFIQEMLTPYEVFQTYAIILWIYEQYYIFSFLLLAYSLYIYWNNSSSIIKNQRKLAQQSFFDLQCRVLMRNQNMKAYEDGQNSEDMSIMEDDDIQRTLQQNHHNNADGFHPMSQEIQPKMHIVTSKKSQIQEYSEKFEPFSAFETQIISSQNIVPGDIIFLTEGDTIPCDCILLTGQILVDQSYISGQSYLIRKRAMENYIYASEKQKTFLLFMGTNIVKTRNKLGRKVQQTVLQAFGENTFELNKLVSDKQVACLVTQTNYNTLRGKYLRALRYQKKSQQKFTQQTIYFIYIIVAITTVAFFILLPVISEGQKPWDLFITYLDLLGDSIPMTLPTALSVGIKFAQHRLKNYGINLVLPSNILAAGRADTIVLDSCKAFGKQYKVQSIMVGIKGNRTFGNTYTSKSNLLDLNEQYSLSKSAMQYPQKKQREKAEMNEKGKLLLQAFSCCHTLERYNDEITGTEQERKLFDFSQGQYVEEDIFECFDEKVNIIERLYFKEKDHKLAVLTQIMQQNSQKSIKNEQKEQISLIQDFEIEHEMKEQTQQRPQEKQKDKAKKENKKLIFMKGPPEKILRICLQATFPHNSSQYIVDMSEKGFKLLCYAYKQIKQQKQFNSKNTILYLKEGFTFLGFAILELQKHQDTPEAMVQLKQGNLHIMLVSQEAQLQTSSNAISNSICTKNQLLLCSKSQQRIVCRGHTQWNSSGEGNDLTQFLTQSQEFITNSYLSLSSGLYENLFMKNDELGTNFIFNKAIIFNSMENRHSRNLYFQLEKRGFSSFAVGSGSNVSQCANLSLQLQRGQCSMLSSFHTQQKSLLTISHCLIVCRAALSTNFHCFSMMILFSLIQFTTVAILQYHYQCITDSQMLYEDLFVTFPIFVTINMTLPANKLSKEVPSGSFFSPRSLASMIGQFIIQFIVQMAFINYMFTIEMFADQRQMAYEQFLKTNSFVETDVALATFILTNYLYLGIVLSTSVSKPWRKPFYTNISYTLTLILLWLYNTGMVFLPSITIDDVRQQNKHKKTEEMLVIATLLGNLVMLLMYFYENFLVWIRQALVRHKKSVDQEIS